MRKFLTFLFAALMSASMFALDPQPGDEWDEGTKTLTVNSNPGSNAYSNNQEIEHVIISDVVTSIGDEAFQDCHELASVTIGNSVESIGNGAFCRCFLTSVTIPNSVISIGDWAFACNLTSVTNYALTPQEIVNPFQNTDFSLCTLYVPAESVSAYSNAYGWQNFGTISAIIPDPAVPENSCGDGLTWEYNSTTNALTISYDGSGTGAMYDFDFMDNPAPWASSRESITSVIIPDGVTHIGSYAFYLCSGLTSIEIPNSVTSIGEGAFLGCEGLETVTIYAESLESYGSGAFDYTHEDLKIYVPAGSVNTYKAGWAAYADKIVAIGGGDEPANPSGSCGANLSWEFNPANGTLTITGTGAMYDYDPDDENYAPWFSSRESITSVIIPSGVTSIGDYAFESCTGLTSITIPNSVKSIGVTAFLFTGLTSVTIPNSVTSIGIGAFGYCPGLETVTINATTPPTLGSDAFFSTAEGLKIYVPAGSEDTYKAAENWSAYADKIEAIAGGDEPATQEITPNVDPQNPTVYYSTFYDSAKKYELPTGVEAYVATIGENVLNLTKIAEAGQVIPNDNAVILKSTVTPFTLTPSDAAPVTFTVDNSLLGTDVATATPANCYVLGGKDGVVGFYPYGGTNLNPHKAYVVFSGSNNAPRRMPFIFDAATGVENVQGNVQSTKVLRDGQLIIIRNGVEYNANGMMVK